MYGRTGAGVVAANALRYLEVKLMATTRMVAATAAFAVMVKGVEVLVRAGNEYPARSIVVKGRKHLFEPVGPAATDG